MRSLRQLGHAHRVLQLAASAALDAAAAGGARPPPAAAAAAAAAAGVRRYARPSGPPGSYVLPPARPAALRLAPVASGVLAEPYRGEPPPLPLSAWVTPSGWRARWRRWAGSAKSVYTIAKCKKYIPGWSLPGFKAEAIDIYARVNAALAAGDVTALRQACAPAVFSDMKRQLRARAAGGWARVEWALERPPAAGTTEVVHGRLVVADPKDEASGFAQLTVRFRSAQRFAAYDARGARVAGGGGGAAEVEDVWVFERPLRATAAARWRLAGRLAVGGAAPAAAGEAPAAAPPVGGAAGSGAARGGAT